MPMANFQNSSSRGGNGNKGSVLAHPARGACHGSGGSDFANDGDTSSEAQHCERGHRSLSNLLPNTLLRKPNVALSRYGSGSSGNEGDQSRRTLGNGRARIMIDSDRVVKNGSSFGFKRTSRYGTKTQKNKILFTIMAGLIIGATAVVDQEMLDEIQKATKSAVDEALHSEKDNRQKYLKQLDLVDVKHEEIAVEAENSAYQMNFVGDAHLIYGDEDVFTDTNDKEKKALAFAIVRNRDTAAIERLKRMNRVWVETMKNLHLNKGQNGLTGMPKELSKITAEDYPWKAGGGLSAMATNTTFQRCGGKGTAIFQDTEFVDGEIEFTKYILTGIDNANWDNKKQILQTNNLFKGRRHSNAGVATITIDTPRIVFTQELDDNVPAQKTFVENLNAAVNAKLKMSLKSDKKTLYVRGDIEEAKERIRAELGFEDDGTHYNHMAIYGDTEEIRRVLESTFPMVTKNDDVWTEAHWNILKVVTIKKTSRCSCFSPRAFYQQNKDTIMVVDTMVALLFGATLPGCLDSINYVVNEQKKSITDADSFIQFCVFVFISVVGTVLILCHSHCRRKTRESWCSWCCFCMDNGTEPPVGSRRERNLTSNAIARKDAIDLGGIPL